MFVHSSIVFLFFFLNISHCVFYICIYIDIIHKMERKIYVRQCFT